MNSVTLVGYLSLEPEVKNIQSGTPLTRFSVAVNDIRGQESYFIPCIAWSNTATYVATYLHKGDFVAVSGRLTRRKFMNNEGKEQYVMEVVADNVKSYGKSRNNNETQNLQQPTAEPGQIVSVRSVINKNNDPVVSSPAASDGDLDWDID